MSVSRLFSFIGDANVKRKMTGLNIASREAIKSAQVLDCSLMSELDTALQAVRPESDVLILASMTEFLLAAGDCGTIFSSIDPILASLVTKIVGFCAFKSTLQVEVSLIHHNFSF